MLGRYRIERSLGRGGMADVYLVFDQRRQVHVALKMLREDLAEDPEFVRRFRREAEALARLDHPNIVRFYGFEQAYPQAWIVMDYVPGTTLRRRLGEAGGPLPLDEVTRILRQVGAALSYAHTEGIVHRDLKPANIMLKPDGTALLSDFGIARAAEATTMTAGPVGTPAYMAPEQILGKTVDGRTDVYGLGAVLWEMTTDRRLFSGETGQGATTAERVRDEHLHATPADPCRLNPTLPPAAGQVILRALAKDPAARWPDVVSFVRAWGQAVAETSAISVGEKNSFVLAHSVSADVGVRQAALPKLQPRYNLWLAIGGVVGVAVVGLFILWFLLPREQPTLPTNASQTPTPTHNAQTTLEVALSTTTVAMTAAGQETAQMQPAVAVATETRLHSTLQVERQTVTAVAIATQAAEATQTVQTRSAVQTVTAATTEAAEAITAELTRQALIPTATPTAKPTPIFPGRGLGKIAFVSNRDGNNEIYLMKADGTALRRLTNHAADDWSPALSADGQRITFTSSRDAQVPGMHNIYVMNADGNGLTRLTWNQAWDEYPAWSPDGTQIAFVTTADNNAEIFAVNMDGSGSRRLTYNQSDEHDPAWSPDGTRLAYASRRGGVWQVFVIDLISTRETRLTTTSANEQHPAWSPDGREITFFSDRDGNSEIYVMNSNGSGQTRLTYNSERDEHPTWSPDGSAIAFWSNRRTNNNDVFVMWADGSQQTQLSTNPMSDGAPSWGR